MMFLGDIMIVNAAGAVRHTQTAVQKFLKVIIIAFNVSVCTTSLLPSAIC